MLVLRALALAALTVAAFPPHPALASASAVSVNDAAYHGIAAFSDVCKTGSVCVTATTYRGACQDTVGGIRTPLLRCDAVLEAHYVKASAGGVAVCAGAGSGTLYFRSSTGTTTPVNVVVVASENVISYSGRYVDAIGQVVYSVEGVVTASCGTRTVPWSGTFQAYEA